MIANDFPIARLEKLSLQALQQGDSEQIQRLTKAASEVGIFYVDLTDSTLGRKVLALLPTLYKTSEGYFAQTEADKSRDVRTDQLPSQDRGYKSCETDETYEMPYDELRDGSIKLPSVLRPMESTLNDFAAMSHQIGVQVLHSLSDGLNRSGTDRLELLANDGSRTSDTALKFISEPAIDHVADVFDNTHTDNGLISMVWCDQWGFVVKDKAEDAGAFARPLGGTVIMHVANTLQRLTNGALRSTVHQVTQPVDGVEPRTFLAFNLRPYFT